MTRVTGEASTDGERTSPDHGAPVRQVMRVAGGRTACRMMPVAVVAPIGFVAVFFVLREAGLCGTLWAMALYGVGFLLVLGGVAAQHARSLHAADMARLAAETALREREGHIHSVLDSLEEVVWSVAVEPFRCLYVNAAVQAIYQRPPAEFYANPRLWITMVHPDDRERVRRTVVDVLAVGSGEIEYRIRRLDDSVRWVHDAWRVLSGPEGRPQRMDGFSIDITDRKEAERGRIELESRAQQIEKLDAVSRLAGGVAHDFNNHLTIIRGQTQFLLKGLPSGAALRGRAEKIAATVDRAARLVRQLLAVSSEQPTRAAVVDLAQLVHEITPMVRLLLGEEIALDLRTPPDVWEVRADAGQLERVIINLVANAKDAIAEVADRSGPGRVVIEVANVGPGGADGCPYDRSGVDSRRAASAGGVVLAVSDNGSGMRAEVQQRIFEPYFTTKPFGRGTGLGLSTAYGVVKQHGGTMTCSSSIGKGTTVRVFLPRCGQSVAMPANAPAATLDQTALAVRLDRGERESEFEIDPTTAQAEPVEAGRAHSSPVPAVAMGTAVPLAPSRGATILLVEDEALVRDVLADIIEGAGYDVHVAASAREAWRLAEAAGWAIDVLVTDVVMPDESGPALARRLLGRCPALKTLLMSGYLGAGGGDETGPDVRLLEKPFSPDALLRQVAQLLGDGGVTAHAGGSSGASGALSGTGWAMSGDIVEGTGCEMGSDCNSLGG